MALDNKDNIDTFINDKLSDLLEELKGSKSLIWGVMHCWGGTLEEMEQFLNFGFYISFSGTVTFPKAKQIQANKVFTFE